MYIHNSLIKLQFPLFLASVLTNELVILTNSFLQCIYHNKLRNDNNYVNLIIIKNI